VIGCTFHIRYIVSSLTPHDNTNVGSTYDVYFNFEESLHFTSWFYSPLRTLIFLTPAANSSLIEYLALCSVS
jgi:hypothetical protein